MSQLPSASHDPQSSGGKSRALKIGAIIVGLILVIGGIVFAVTRGQDKGDQTAATPVASTSAATSVPPTTPVPATSAAPQPGTPEAIPADSCTTLTGDMTSPQRFIVDARKVDSKMITVGKDSDGNPGAPPASEGQQTAWFNGSPEVGHDKGNTILTIHTYQDKFGANALGNKLYSDSQGLKPGDVIRIEDANGKQVCYRYRENKKVWVATYDDKSGVFHNLEGRPQLAIMICWDHNDKSNEWDSRIIFYADLMKPGEKS